MVSSSSAFTKEINIRRRITSIFNKREDDFPSLRDYNDYLEEIEDMTFNLIEGIDVAVIEDKIKRYQEENAEQILNSRARRLEEHLVALRASEGPRSIAKADTADEVRDRYNSGATSQGGVGTTVGVQGQYAPAAVPGVGLGQPRPTMQPVPVGGHIDPLQGYAADSEEAIKLRAERAARAGGWTIELSRKRALEEAFSSVWI